MDHELDDELNDERVTDRRVDRRRQQERRHRGRVRLRTLIAAGSVVAIVLLAILVDSTLYYNKVHTGVSVAGLSLGGLTHDEATAALQRLVQDAQDRPITVRSGDKTWSVMPAEVGTDIDVAAAVTAAMDVTRKSNFFVDLARRFNLYFSHKDLPLEGAVDSAMMDEVLAGIAREIDVPPVPAGLSIEGTNITAVEGRKGNVVDQDALGEELKAVLFTLHATEVAVPMVVKEPDVTAEDNEAALEQARTMINSPVTLKNGEQTWTLSTEDIAAYMDFTSEDQNGVSTLVPYLSAEKMSPFFQEIAALVATEPVDATFDSDGTKAWVVAAIPGRALDPEKTAESLTAAALKTTGRTARVMVTTSEPDLTTEEAGAMGITDRLASYTTEPYYGTLDRQVNVRLTTKYASDVFLAPGDVYDFDKQIGPRTAERGYKLAKGIVGEGKLEDVLGGGICQVSTTLFNAVFDAGLKVVERHNHSLYISHYPDGRDATVSGGSKNFRFQNDTAHYIWIRGTSDGVTTTFNIYGTYDGRKVSSTFSGFYSVVERTDVTVVNPSLGPGTTNISIPGQSGKQCKVVRKVKMPDGTVLTDTFISIYPMYQRIIEVPPTTTTTWGTTTSSTPPVTNF